MEVEDLVIVDVLDHVAARQQGVALVGPLDEDEVLIISTDVPFYGMFDVRPFFRQIEQAVALVGQTPFLAGPDVVQDRPGLTGEQEADVFDAGVDHIGKREVDEAVFAADGQRRQRARVVDFLQGMVFAHIDEADHITIHN